MGAKILYVEDSKKSLDLVEVIVTRRGYEFVGVEDGRRAIDIIKTEQPDLILLDYHLIGIDGIELLHILKADETTAHIPAVGLTADIYSEHKFKEAGCDGYLTKPIHKHALLTMIDKMLAPAT